MFQTRSNTIQQLTYKGLTIAYMEIMLMYIEKKTRDCVIEGFCLPWGTVLTFFSSNRDVVFWWWSQLLPRLWERPSSPGNSGHSALPSLLLLHPCGRYLSPSAPYSPTFFKCATNVHCDWRIDCFTWVKLKGWRDRKPNFGHSLTIHMIITAKSYTILLV